MDISILSRICIIYLHCSPLRQQLHGLPVAMDVSSVSDDKMQGDSVWLTPPQSVTNEILLKVKCLWVMIAATPTFISEASDDRVTRCFLLLHTATSLLSMLKPQVVPRAVIHGRNQILSRHLLLYTGYFCSCLQSRPRCDSGIFRLLCRHLAGCLRTRFEASSRTAPEEYGPRCFPHTNEIEYFTLLVILLFTSSCREPHACLGT